MNADIANFVSDVKDNLVKNYFQELEHVPIKINLEGRCAASVYVSDFREFYAIVGTVPSSILSESNSRDIMSGLIAPNLALISLDYSEKLKYCVLGFIKNFVKKKLYFNAIDLSIKKGLSCELLSADLYLDRI